MSLLVPESVLADREAERFVEERMDVARHWDRELQQLDRRLSLVWVNENAVSPGLVPGRWHVRRVNERTADSFMAITGPHGEYRDMGSDVIEGLKRGDSWNPRVVRERREREEKQRKAAERDKELRREQRRDMMAEAASAAQRVPGTGGMTKRRWGAG